MNLLISKPDALGDQFIAAGIVQALQRLRPELRIVWHVRAGMEVFAPLLGARTFIPDPAAAPGLEAARLGAQPGPLIVVPYPLSPYESWTDDLRRRLAWWADFVRATSWDAAVLAQVNRNWVGDFTVAVAPSGQRIGFAPSPARQPLVNEAQALAGADAPAFTTALAPSLTRSEAGQLRDLFATLEPRLATNEPASLWQPVPGSDPEPALVSRPPSGADPLRRRILIAPGVGADPRRAWGAGNFLRVADSLRARGMTVSWLEGPGDAAHLDTLPPAESDHRIRFGAGEIPRLVRELQACDLLLCHDTAYVHIAAGIGLPTVAIFGAGQDTRFHPPGGRVKIVQGRIACAGCQWHCLWDRMVCIAELPVDRVLTAVEQMLTGDAAPMFIPLATPVTGAPEGEPAALKRRLQDEVLTLNADRFARLQIIQNLLSSQAGVVGTAAAPPRTGNALLRGEGAASPTAEAPIGKASTGAGLGEVSTESPTGAVPIGEAPTGAFSKGESTTEASQAGVLTEGASTEGASTGAESRPSEPKLSVIIPMGRPDRVASTLASLAAQQRKPSAWEIVLVGVGAESVARSHPHLPIVPVPLDANQLPPRTRCLGVERATGDWFLFLDDDVDLAPECHARFTDLLATPPFATDATPAVGAVGFRLPGKSSRFFERLTDISNFWAQQHETAEDRDWLYSAALLVRADAYRRSGGFNPDLPNGEDVDLTRRIAAAGYRLRYEPALVARHDHRRDTLFAMWRYFWRNGNAARYFFAAHGGACPFSVKSVWLKAWSDLQMNLAFQRGRGRSLGSRTPLVWLNYLIVEASLDWHWQEYLREERRYRKLPARARSDTTYVLAMIDWEEGRKFTGFLRHAWAVIQDFENPVRR